MLSDSLPYVHSSKAVRKSKFPGKLGRLAFCSICQFLGIWSFRKKTRTEPVIILIHCIHDFIFYSNACPVMGPRFFNAKRMLSISTPKKFYNFTINYTIFTKPYQFGCIGGSVLESTSKIVKFNLPVISGEVSHNTVGVCLPHGENVVSIIDINHNIVIHNQYRARAQCRNGAEFVVKRVSLLPASKSFTCGNLRRFSSTSQHSRF